MVPYEETANLTSFDKITLPASTHVSEPSSCSSSFEIFTVIRMTLAPSFSSRLLSIPFHHWTLSPSHSVSASSGCKRQLKTTTRITNKFSQSRPPGHYSTAFDQLSLTHSSLSFLLLLKPSTSAGPSPATNTGDRSPPFGWSGYQNTPVVQYLRLDIQYNCGRRLFDSSLCR